MPQVLVDESDCQLPAIEGEVAVEKTAKKRIMASLRRFLGKAPKERVASSSQIRSSVSSIAPVEKGFGSVTTRPPSYRLLGHDQKAAPFHSNSSPLTSKQHPRESMLLPAWESPDSISAPLPVIDPQATPNSGTSPPSLSPLASSRGRLPAPGQELQPCSSASSTPNGQYLRSRTTDLPSSSMSPRCNTNTSSHANASANATSIDPVGGVARAINAASRLLRGAPNSQLMPSQRTPSALSASTAAQPMRRFATADLESNTNAFAAPTSPYERFPSGLPYSPLGAWGEEAAAEEERPARERRPPPLQLPPVQVTPPHIMPVAGQMAAADATVGRSHGGRSGSSGNSPWERLPLQLVTACAPPAMQHAVGTCAWGLEDFHVYGMLYEGPSSAVYKVRHLEAAAPVSNASGSVRPCRPWCWVAGACIAAAAAALRSCITAQPVLFPAVYNISSVTALVHNGWVSCWLPCRPRVYAAASRLCSRCVGWLTGALETACTSWVIATNRDPHPGLYSASTAVCSFCSALCVLGMTCTAPCRTAQVYNLERLPRNLIHRLVREVRIHSDLQHKNVVQMYGVFQVRHTVSLPRISKARNYETVPVTWQKPSNETCRPH